MRCEGQVVEKLHRLAGSHAADVEDRRCVRAEQRPAPLESLAAGAGEHREPPGGGGRATAADRRVDDAHMAGRQLGGQCPARLGVDGAVDDNDRPGLQRGAQAPDDLPGGLVVGHTDGHDVAAGGQVLQRLRHLGLERREWLESRGPPGMQRQRQSRLDGPARHWPSLVAEADEAEPGHAPSSDAVVPSRGMTAQ